MLTSPMKLITIVAETVLAEKLSAELRRLGAHGWTMIDARGDGARGMRTGPLPGENVQIETVVDTATADRILETLSREYFPNYALVAWMSDVQVIRGAKYSN